MLLTPASRAQTTSFFVPVPCLAAFRLIIGAYFGVELLVEGFTSREEAGVLALWLFCLQLKWSASNVALLGFKRLCCTVSRRQWSWQSWLCLVELLHRLDLYAVW